MEMASSSSTSNLSDSLNCLKFGQKIYFEDVGIGVPAKSGGGSLSSAAGAPPWTPPKKGRNGVVQGGRPPRCQVEGCKVDLSDAKAYYSRHKVCGMHSKSPKVIVGGLEQRFCQQCSRFHQLPEFDQGKRSCRRRLAGHNERRRKPPPGSLLSSHCRLLSSSIFENNSRAGSFLMDFTAGKDPWPTTRASERVLGNQPTSTSTSTGKFLQHPRHSSSENPPLDFFLPVSASGTAGIPSGECFSGVSSDSTRALSLLSNQPWGSRNRPSSLGVDNFLNANGAPMIQKPTAPPGASVNRFSSTPWGFKNNNASSSLQETAPDLGLGRISHPANAPYYNQVDLAQQSARQYMDWSL